MDDSSRRRMTFSVSLKPARLFLQSLITMRMMVTSAVLIVKNGEIQVLAISQDRKSVSSLRMEASTASSWSSNRYALLFDLRMWIELLLTPVFHKHAESMGIYNISDGHDLYCLVGNDLTPIQFGTANFVQESGIDMRSLNHHGVRVNLITECFRDVLTAFAHRFAHDMMMAFTDNVSFHTVSGYLTYHTQNGDCLIRGVEADQAAYLLIEWRQAMTLRSASKISQEVAICPLIGQRWRDWILFNFLVDDRNCFSYMMEGSDIQIVHPDYYGGRYSRLPIRATL